MTTTGDGSPGVYAIGLGGQGNDGGMVNDGALGQGIGGSGGAGGAALGDPSGGNPFSVSVSLASASISTQGTSAPGIVAQSEGGGGGNGTGGGAHVAGGDGGNGGAAGTVGVTVDASSTIQTAGDNSVGILAQSLGGSAGAAGAGSSGGRGGTGGDSSTVTVTNGGTVSTAGQSAHGIVVQSLAGGGGAGGASFSLFHSGGGSGAAGGTSGAVAVTETGSVATGGANAFGILLQSVGGGGGVGGIAGDSIWQVGGSGGFAADGNAVTFTGGGGDTAASISTAGVSATGVLGQSIGGGGGDGGVAAGLEVAIGGSGGAGGSGGEVTANLNSLSVTTLGDNAAGVVMQSIGGGGGNAGNAGGVGLFLELSIGGSGGSGSNGGDVTINSTGATITTTGSKALGLVAQSIGGGGGTGGAALAGSVGAGFSSTTTVGGSGGSGSNGGVAQATVVGGLIATGQNPFLVNGGTMSGGLCTTSTGASFTCNQFPIDAYGAVVQSIGGGGGLGGSALAQSVAIAVPVTEAGTQFGMAVSVGLGGKGGSGGLGGEADFSLSNGGKIKTSGQGSTAVLVQSIGGGGGAGGDSSATSTVLGYGTDSVPAGASSTGVEISYSQGGNGGSGSAGGNVNVAIGGTITSNGNGNPATFTADPSGSAPTSITTYNDFADGIKAQSIGGGGGDAGFGSGNTQDFGTGNTASLSLTMGSSGGTGATGGAVTVGLYPGNGITTYGSGSIGIVAQSIGGGGGASQGGSINVTGGKEIQGTTYKPGMKINLGTLGSTPANGGGGGTVTVDVGAPITTHGGDATGVLVQSIGGGGGLGGSAGADASADNPIIAALNGQESLFNNIHDYLGNGSTTIDPTLALSIGGTGGSGNVGGQATANIASTITRSGDWANGVIVQSIGGGGGKGGTSVATGTGGVPEVTINLDIALGGGGGTGGEGGAATVTPGPGNPSIGTQGFGATGVIVQSIGAGGGIGGDGSDVATGTITVGGAVQGSSNNDSAGGSGSGGTATFDSSNASVAWISTSGDAADGVVLQSIGGGGGIGGAGSSFWSQNNRPQLPGGSPLKLNAGGGGKANGSGGTVTFDSSNGPVSISTSGYNSFGVLAQSIGGGGGLVSANSTNSTQNSSTPTQYTEVGGLGTGDGGAVNITLGNGSQINTSGTGAYGIFAQSVGGGGGALRVLGDPSGAQVLATRYINDQSHTPQFNPSTGNGGDVNVTINQGASISVSGSGSIGIFAQSVGGGGGLIANGTGSFAGAPLAGQVSGSAKGGPVSVTVNDSVSATGQNGIGIFAQTAGYGTPTGQVDVLINNYDNQGTTISGGTGSGSAGVWIDTPANGPVAYVTNDWATITTADGTSGTAITVTGGGQIAVANNSGTIDGTTMNGTITGSIYTNGGQVDGNGTFNAGPMMEAANVVTSGTFNLGMPGELRATRVTGNFVQTGEGRLGVTVDSLNKTAGHLQVDGNATLDGKIVPTALTLLPGALPVVTAGHLVSTADGANPLLFHWDTAQSGNTLSIAPRSNFKPGGVALNDSQASLAGYYGRAWDNADKAFATRFAELSRISDGSDYKAALDAWSSKATHAQSIALANSAGTILGAAMSCPVFVDDTVLLGEDNCVWAKVTGRWTDQSSTRDTQGYYVSGTTYRIGAQHEIAPDWYLGASFGFGQSWATMEGGSSGDGDTYDGSVTVKRVMGPWQFAGSVAFAGGSFEANRRVDIPGIASETLKSDPGIFLAGGRLRAAYEFAFDDWYIRPYGDLDVVYTDLPGFTEKGDDLYALDVRGSSKAGVALSPMVEFGGRLDLDAQSTLRAYAAFGMSYLPDNTRTIHSSFVGASSANGTFSDHIDSPEVLGRIDVGLQLFRAGGFELKGEYTADIGGSFLSQSASARAAYHF
ncbi:hypothetical protein KXR53_32155 [Inquilinus limosus]|uniref:hypothetical protein n=1 Tax=Inquilinus limosus TaxID=171674 RepID=UPI003F163484